MYERKLKKILIGGVSLTHREVEVLACISNGLDYKSTGKLMGGIAAGTVGTALQSIKAKAGCVFPKDVIKILKTPDDRRILNRTYYDLVNHEQYKSFLEKSKELKKKNRKVAIYYAAEGEEAAKSVKNDLQTVGCKVILCDGSEDKKEVAKSYVKLYINESSAEVDLSKIDYVLDIYNSGYNLSCLNFLSDLCGVEVSTDRPNNLSRMVPKKRIVEARENTFELLIRAIEELHMKITNKMGFIGAISVYVLMTITAVLVLYQKSDGKTFTVLDNKLLISSDILLERSEILKKIDFLLEQNNPINTVILVGIGGSGKTTLSRKYASNSKMKIIYEINAETTESAYNSLVSLANDLIQTDNDREEWKFIDSITDINRKRRRVVNFVHSKLLINSGKWLLVFDNVENLQSIIDMFPLSSAKCGNGKVILTTRNATVAESTLLGKVSKMEIGELSKQEKIKLFEKVYMSASNKKYDMDKLELLLDKIPAFPLDVVSVAYYLGTYGVSEEEYLSRMNTIEDGFDAVCRSLLLDRTSYGRTRYGIVASTLSKVIEDLGDKEMYKNLLFLISMCDSQDIPVKLLEKCTDVQGATRLLLELKKHCFISISGNKLSIHRSVQEIWFHILKNKINEQSFNKLMNNIFDYVSVKEVLNNNYKSNIITLDKDKYTSVSPHLQFIAKNIDKCECLSKRSIAEIKANSLFVVAAFKQLSGENAKVVADMYMEAIELDEKYNIFSSYEKAVLIGGAGHAFASMRSENGILLLRKAADIALKIPDAEALIIARLIGVGSAEIRQGNFSEGQRILETALGFVPENKSEIWVKKSYSQVKYMITKYKLRDSLNNKDVVLDCKKDFLEILNTLNMNNIRMHGNRKKKEVYDIVQFVKWNLAILYNTLEEYKSVYEIYQDAKFIYENFSSSGSLYLLTTAEYGISLLRLGEINKSYNLFNRVFETMEQHSQIADKMFVVKALSEIEIRTNKYQKALDTVVNFVENKGYFPKETRERLNYTDCLYNAALASYKVNKLDDAEKYFGMFMKNIHELCGTLISADNLKKLNDEGVFKEQPDIKVYLLNAYKIYAAIFGTDHAFVKDYVHKNIPLIAQQGVKNEGK